MSAPMENSKVEGSEAVEASNAPEVVQATTEPVKEEEKAVKQPVLSPAPVPASSPWKAVPSVAAAPASSGSHKWPSAQQAVEKLERRERQGPVAPVIKSTGKEKWVPMKASIVVSGSKKFNGAGGSGPSKKQGGKKPRRGNTTSGSRPKKVQSSVARDEKDDAAPVATATEVSSDSAESAESPSQSQESASNGAEKGPGFHRKHQENGHKGGFTRGTFSQGHHRNDNHGSFKSHQHYTSYSQKPGSAPFRQHHSNRPFNPAYRQKYPQKSSGPGFYNPQPPHPFVAVNNIARQIEYYFSAENLAKDNYLRSQFIEDGFAPLSLIAKFYRMVNLSFGGDETLVLGALREIVANETATVDVAELHKDVENKLEKYYIRSKNWQQWVGSSEDSTEAKSDEAENQEQRSLGSKTILTNDALDAFRISPPAFEAPAPREDAQESTESSAVEVATETEA